MPKKYERRYTRQCRNCLKLFDTARPDAKCCGPRCRHVVYEEKLKLIAAEERIVRALNDLEDALNDPLLAALAYRLIKESRSAIIETVIEASMSDYGRQQALKEIMQGQAA